MKLEGKLAGVYVEELRRAWLALAPTVSHRQLSLDLRGLTFVDERGLQVLREVRGATRAVVLAESPLTKHFADLAMQAPTNDDKGELP
jgi:hypothetical protein